MKTIAKPIQTQAGWRHPRYRRAIGIATLVLLTLLWGSTFVLMKDGLTELPPGSFMGLRFGISALALLPLWRRSLQPSGGQLPPGILRAGLELGLLLFAGYGTQTLGLIHTTVHRSAFITSLNVVFVPLILSLAGRRVGWRAGLAALVAVAGVGLLSYDGAPPNWGDLWTLGTAIAYAFYIIRIDYYVTHFPALALSIVQLIAMAGLSLGWMLLQDGAWLRDQIQSGAGLQLPWGLLFFLALACTTLTTLLQLWGQQRVPPAQASVLFTLEPVWASLFALGLLGEHLSLLGIVGAGAICCASLLAIAPSQALEGSVVEGEGLGS